MSEGEAQKGRLCSDLTGVHIGDMLLVSGSGQTWNRLRVTRITAKQVVVGEGRSATHYWKKNGNRVGDSGVYSYSFAYVYDEVAKEKWRELVARSNERDLRRLVREADWNKVTVNDLRAFAGMLLNLEAFKSPDDVRSLLARMSEVH